MDSPSSSPLHGTSSDNGKYDVHSNGTHRDCSTTGKRTAFADGAGTVMPQVRNQRRQASASWAYVRQQYAKLDDLLASYGLERVQMPSDGNCLFHAISSFFNDPRTDHRAVRRRICEYIDTHRDQFAPDIECDYPSVDVYLREMRRVGEWGDAIMVQAFCLAYDVNVVLFTPGRCSELYPGNDSAGNERPKMGLVAYEHHYTATRLIDGQQRRLESGMLNTDGYDSKDVYVQ